MSTLKVGTIADHANGNSAITIDSSGNTSIPSGRVLNAPGHIIQVQTLNPTVANKQITSTSFVTSEIAINITPNFSSSKILISCCFNIYKSASGTYVYCTIYKDSTNLGHATYGMGEFSGLGAAGGQLAHLQILNSPNTTSQVTYTMFARVNSGDVYVQSNSAVGNITAMEIAS